MLTATQITQIRDKIHNRNYYIDTKQISSIWFAEVQFERNFVEAVVEDIKIPHDSIVSEDSWNKDSDYVLIPKEIFNDGKGVWMFYDC